jgi:hypothetical protein
MMRTPHKGQVAGIPARFDGKPVGFSQLGQLNLTKLAADF